MGYNFMNPTPEQYYMEHLNDVFVEETYHTGGRRPLFFPDDIGVRHAKYKAWLLKNHNIKVLSDQEVQFQTREAFDTFMYEAEKLNTLRVLQNG